MRHSTMDGMFKNQQRVFVLLIFLTGFLAVFNLPDKFPINLTLFGNTISRTIHSPVIDVPFFDTRIQKSFTTQLGLDLSGGTQLVLEADMSEVEETDRQTALDSATQIIEKRINFFGVTEPIVQSARTADSYRIIVEMPGVTDVDQAVETIGQTARLEFRELLEDPPDPESTESAFFFPTIDNTKPTDLTGKDLKRATLTFSQQTGEPEVALEFTPDGAEKFKEITTRLVEKPLPVFIDEFPLTWPRVSTPITDGFAVITGGFSKEGAKTLALQLNAGALPVPIEVIEKRTIGATLGQESVEKSIRAGFFGLFMVAVYMILYYGWLGVFADMALIVYGLLTFFIFRLIPITLTLPGIAGFILSIGMAVDSNILIFERYKEEVRQGKPWQIAMELGFGRAWDSIRDANITTLLTCAILYNPGNWSFLPTSGMVRGFAATLFIGVVTSLFTGIIVTRTFIRMMYRPRKVKNEKSKVKS